MCARRVFGKRAKGNDSYSDVAIELLIVGAVGRTHATFGDSFDDGLWRTDLPRRENCLFARMVGPAER